MAKRTRDVGRDSLQGIVESLPEWPLAQLVQSAIESVSELLLLSEGVCSYSLEVGEQHHLVQ